VNVRGQGLRSSSKRESSTTFGEEKVYRSSYFVKGWLVDLNFSYFVAEVIGAFATTTSEVSEEEQRQRLTWLAEDNNLELEGWLAAEDAQQLEVLTKDHQARLQVHRDQEREDEIALRASELKYEASFYSD